MRSYESSAATSVHVKLVGSACDGLSAESRPQNRQECPRRRQAGAVVQPDNLAGAVCVAAPPLMSASVKVVFTAVHSHSQCHFVYL